MARGCPKCKSAISATAERPSYFPFCSERCRLLDLGAWLDGEYRIAGEAVVEDEGSTEPSDDE